jgi:hypothetical protein
MTQVPDQEQLERWLGGESVHNLEGECCPDFSCCRPNLRWSYELRKQFIDGDESVRMGMLLLSVDAAVLDACPNTNLYFPGDGLLN